MAQVQILRIVVASPGDVQPERNALPAVVDELNSGIARDRGLRLELARWETDAYPGFHPEGPQGLIDAILRIEECDILIGIFWKRFGTPVHKAQSGTEHEFRRGYAAWQQTGRPQMMVYFNQRAYTPKTREETDQWGQVLDFQRNFPKEGLWWPYRGKSQFERLVRTHLTQFLRQRMPDASGMHRPPSEHRPPGSLEQHGSGAIAIGPQSTAAGESGVAVGGNVYGNIIIGTPSVPEPPASPVNPESAAPQFPSARAGNAGSAEVRRQLELMRSLQLGARERVAAGNALAHLGDPRFRADAWYLPDESLLGFVEIPAGPFLMGSDQGRDPAAYGDELGYQEVTLPAYYIARYPVSVAQFWAFVEASGYRPGNEDCLQGLPNHPVGNVTWYESLQYCDWLTDRLRDWAGTPEPLATLLRQEHWCVTLPSEAEWEKAARGSDGRIYPWGNDHDPNRANEEATGIHTTSAVGCFPRGASPYRIEDLIGNVWEWTRSLWGADWGQPTFQYPYSPDDGREDRDTSPDVFRVLRGGAFDSLPRFSRCAFRLRNRPNDRFKTIGFRVVVRPYI